MLTRRLYRRSFPYVGYPPWTPPPLPTLTHLYLTPLANTCNARWIELYGRALDRPVCPRLPSPRRRPSRRRRRLWWPRAQRSSAAAHPTPHADKRSSHRHQLAGLSSFPFLLLGCHGQLRDVLFGSTAGCPCVMPSLAALNRPLRGHPTFFLTPFPSLALCPCVSGRPGQGFRLQELCLELRTPPALPRTLSGFASWNFWPLCTLHLERSWIATYTDSGL